MGSFLKEAAILVARKTITLLIVLLLILTIEFLFFRVGIGAEGYFFPKGVTPQVAEHYREVLHLNDSIVVQYFYFVVDMLSGGGSFDMDSYISHLPIREFVYDSFWRTIMLFGFALIFSVLVGLLAAYAVWKMRGRAWKTISMSAMFVLWTVPVLLLAALFLIQIVSRFEIDWAIRNPLHGPDHGWLDRFLYDVGQRVFPIIILTIVSFGGFSLIALQGIKRSRQALAYGSGLDDVRTPSFFECISSVMPSMKLNLAFIMSCVLFLEVFWLLDGLGYRVFMSMFNLEIPTVEVCVFLILLIVLISGYILDLVFSVLAIRPSRESRAVPLASNRAMQISKDSGSMLAPLPGDLVGEAKWFALHYSKSLTGIVGGILLIAVAILALVGPLVVEEYNPISAPEPDPVSQFVLGFRDPFVQTLAILVLSMVIGFFVALLVMPLGKFNYPVVLVAESFIVFPILGMILITQLVWVNVGVVLPTVLVTWTPVALILLRRGKTIDEDYRARFPTETGLARYKGELTECASKTLPDAVAALKYVAVVGMLSVLAFGYSFYGSLVDGSWGSMFGHAIQYMKIYEFDLWWILPMIGFMVTVSGFYLVLQATQDVLEKRFRSAVAAPSPQSPGP